MKVRWDPRRQRFPGIKGKLMVDTFRGQIRVRKWPRKRGEPKSQVTRDQNTWFKQANELARQVEPTQMNLAIAMTKGTGLYPRDLLLRQMAGGIYHIILADGTSPEHRRYFREAKMFQGAILELDADQALPAGVWTTIVWPLPILDTAGFWNAGQPTRLTIPAGIEVIALSAGWLSTTNIGAPDNAARFLRAGVEEARNQHKAAGFGAMTPSKGAIVVTPGDYFEFAIFTAAAATTEGDRRTFFNLDVLQAT